MLVRRMVGRLNFFEKLLFMVGIAVTITGFYFINKMYTGEGHISWALLQSAFLWLVLLFLIILTDSNEAIKEELKTEISLHAKETRDLKVIAQKQLDVMTAMMGKHGVKKAVKKKKK